jgi:hypothetical protein
MRWSLLFIAMGLACQDAERARARIAPRFEVKPDREQIGFDTPFSIVVHVLAPPERLDVRWTQVGGPALGDIAVTDGGLRFSARTPRLSDCREEPIPWGIVPLSPRTRGEVVLQAEWRNSPGQAPHQERIVVAAAARSRGLPNVPVDQRIYLGGSGWHVREAPPGAGTTLQEHDGMASFRPAFRGIWQLIDGEGHALRIQAGRYVETPLDCGRATCHAEIARAAQSSPMTWALAHRLQGASHTDAASSETGPPRDISCAVRCHVTGEPGTHDGGFFDVASDLGVSWSLEHVGKAAELPRALRRLGSVGCLACHGPSALPEAHARWSILRSDVCAHCHDAPPRYGHVVAWRTTSMARADRDPRARSDRACTPCHTTWGFLREIDARVEQDKHDDRAPPPGVGTIGITCAACHAVHDASAGAERRPGLLRSPRLSAMFDHLPAEARARSGTCLPCHTPREGAPLAQASAAALWAGRAGIDPETGAAITGPSPHVSVEGGCVGCHRHGKDDVEHGQNHGFRADRQRCHACHDGARDLAWADERMAIEKQARGLWRDLLAVSAAPRSKREPLDPAWGPPHKTTATLGAPHTALRRAAYDLSLLLEDRGFLAHNLPYARVLLDKAKKPIEEAARAANHARGKADR